MRQMTADLAHMLAEGQAGREAWPALSDALEEVGRLREAKLLRLSMTGSLPVKVGSKGVRCRVSATYQRTSEWPQDGGGALWVVNFGTYGNLRADPVGLAGVLPCIVTPHIVDWDFLSHGYSLDWKFTGVEKAHLTRSVNVQKRRAFVLLESLRQSSLRPSPASISRHWLTTAWYGIRDGSMRRGPTEHAVGDKGLDFWGLAMARVARGEMHGPERWAGTCRRFRRTLKLLMEC